MKKLSPDCVECERERDDIDPETGRCVDCAEIVGKVVERSHGSAIPRRSLIDVDPWMPAAGSIAGSLCCACERPADRPMRVWNGGGPHRGFRLHDQPCYRIWERHAVTTGP